MLSNSDLRENRAIIYNAKCQICNAPYDDRKINNLCRSFRHLISSVVRSVKTCTHLSMLYAPAITLHSMRMMFTLMIFIDSFDSCHCRGSNTRFENSNSNSMLRFGKIYSISALNLALHCIVISADS